MAAGSLLSLVRARGPILAVLLNLAWGITLIAQHSGLQYDEALLVQDAVQVLAGGGEIPLPHDPDTWACWRGHCLPLMAVRYVGALKSYAALPVFAAFGTSAVAVRAVSLLLGAAGLGLLGLAVRRSLGPDPGWVAPLLLAVNPAYVGMTVFDNGAVAAWMACLGLLWVLLERYLAAPSAGRAAAAGVAAGLALWARANFLWYLAALAVAALVVTRAARVPWRHAAAAAGGALLGGLPLLAYEAISGCGTCEAMGMFTETASRWTVGGRRLLDLAHLLVTDREHREMWAAPEVTRWPGRVAGLLVLGALWFHLFEPRGERPARALLIRTLALSTLLYAAILLTSRMVVADHHLSTLLPPLAILAALAFTRPEVSRGAGAALLGAYLLMAGWQQAEQLGGLARTGGAGVWSDAGEAVTAAIAAERPEVPVKFLDWGIQSNFFVLTGGRIASRELYADATWTHGAARRPWAGEIQEGGLAVLPAPGRALFPDGERMFSLALEASGARVETREFRQRDGVPVWRLLRIAPGAAAAAAPLVPRPVPLAGPGIHAPDPNGSRWTAGEFALPLPAGAGYLEMEVFVPETILERQGPVTLTGSWAGREVARQRFTAPGRYRLRTTRVRQEPEAAAVRFRWDKPLAPGTAGDARELGGLLLGADFLAVPD